MSQKPKIVCVVPSIRPEQMEKFRAAWEVLFRKHKVTLITVWDGDVPSMTITHHGQEGIFGEEGYGEVFLTDPWNRNQDLFCRFTDACRNIGFVVAAQMGATHILTLDDDVVPLDADGNSEWSRFNDPIQAHIDVLNRHVPISWMNTAHDTDLYLRGVPYGVRYEAPVMLSHGVWVGTPDFDGETQLRLENEPRMVGGTMQSPSTLPYSLPYYVGPVPKGVLFPLCGMNVMVKAKALPYLYFAPMGPDTGIMRTEYINKTGREIRKGEFVTGNMVEPKEVPALNRFADIWMGIFLKKQFDELGWACVTGASTVLHTRASDARKNFEQERLGREWNEAFWQVDGTFSSTWLTQNQAGQYYTDYAEKRARYAKLIRDLQGGGS